MSRAERVAELIKQELCDILTKKIRDPRIGFASITDVTITEDLKIAKIFVSVLGTEEQKEDTMRGIQSAAGFMKRQLGQRLELRDIPELLFRRDDSLERGAKVFALLNQLEKEKEERDERKELKAGKGKKHAGSYRSVKKRK
jgi:ribosome-binding factor A